VLGFSLEDAAQSTLQASMGPRPVTRLAQQQPDPLLGDHRLRELLRLGGLNKLALLYRAEGR
jgi:hypothetical protein